MMKTKHHQVFLLVSSILILIGLSTIIPHASLNPLQSGFFNAEAETLVLPLGTPLTGQVCAKNGNYFYATGASADPTRYQVIWVQPSGGGDVDLYVYSDSIFAALIGSSENQAASLEWVVFRPNVSQPFYAKVFAVKASTCAIEWDDSVETLTTSVSRSNSLSNVNAIDAYSVDLTTNITYMINITVAATGDFDLYLYSLAQGGVEDSHGYIIASDGAGLGGEESIWITPSVGGRFAVLVVWSSGTGTYTLTLQTATSTGSSPLNLWLFPVIEIPVFFGVAFGVVGILYLHKYLKNRPNSGEGN